MTMTMNTLIFNVLMALIVSIIGVITKTLLPYLKEKKEEATAKIRQTKWEWAADIIDAVVRAVEQTASESLHGIEKKSLAVAYIESLLAQNGITLSHEQIDALVEAAVQAINEGTIKVPVDDDDVIIPDDDEEIPDDKL